MTTPAATVRYVMAYERGKTSRERGGIRVAPFYEEKEIRDGRSVNITDELDRFWYAGYDGLRMPE